MAKHRDDLMPTFSAINHEYSKAVRNIGDDNFIAVDYLLL